MSEFESKYGVKYEVYGTIAPAFGCAIQYNETVFKFLDDTYGKAWREVVRKDVAGLEN